MGKKIKKKCLNVFKGKNGKVGVRRENKLFFNYNKY